MENYYSFLGVEPSSSKQEIRKAYLKLLKKYHPDIFKGDKETAENVTIELNNAYKILSDIEKRRDYDSKLKANGNYEIKQKPQEKYDNKTSSDKNESTEKKSNTKHKFKSDENKDFKTEVNKRENVDKNTSIRKREKDKTSLSKTKLNFAIIAVVLAIVGLLIILILT